MKLPHIEGRFTWPDFPEQDWKLWEARKFFDRHPFLVFGVVCVSCWVFLSIVTSGAK